MYATRLVNHIYHLVSRSEREQTLCGLRVSRIPPEIKLVGNLQLVEEVPPSKSICKHCQRIQSQAA
jgi:hypothetical protein